MTLEAFLQSMIADPCGAGTTWLVLADWLEDHGDPRSELVRLLHQPDFHSDWTAQQRDERVRQLPVSGLEPVVPTLVNSLGMTFALIPAGVCLMGSPDGEGDEDEHPRHEVEITQPFFMGVYQVTQKEYRRVMSSNPSYFCQSGGGKDKVKELDTKHFPVESVSWGEAKAFCDALSRLPEEKSAGRTYRLPTEAEWEYACRGGATSHTAFHFGKSLSSTQANFDGYHPRGGAAKGPTLKRPCPVGSFPANAFGLFDMHGNVWEWCFDRYDENYYQNSPKRNPQGPDSGRRRVLRGGSWLDDEADYCRSARRGGYAPGGRYDVHGFRVCCLLDL